MSDTIVLLPGDGVGPALLAEARRVFAALDFRPRFVEADIGWRFWCEEGEALPARTVDLLKAHGVGLLAAIESRPAAEAEAALAPALQGRGLRYLSPIISLRQRLALDRCVRPCRSLPGNPLSAVRRGEDGGLEDIDVDVLLVIQNTEGLFAGLEWPTLRGPIRDAIDAHPRAEAFDAEQLDEAAASLRLVSRRSSERIARCAFELAAQHSLRRVTLADKLGVLQASAAPMISAARAEAARHPGIELELLDVDTTTQRMVQRPEHFGVLLTTALLGDILSDGFAGLVGGKGFAASASLGDDCAVFEPCHGSAPQLAGTGLANPLATFEACAMLLAHIGEEARAAALRGAIADVVRRGEARSYDMLRLDRARARQDARVAGTSELTDAVISSLRRGRESQ